MTSRSLRLMGLACAWSAAIAVAVGVVNLVQDPAVPKTQWSYPSTPAQLAVVSVFLAAAHVMEGLGFLALTVLRPYGVGRAPQIATWVAIVGFGVFTIAELASGAIGAQREDSAAASVVTTVFIVATLLTAVGGLVAGVAIVRTQVWRGLTAWSVLLTAVVILLLVTPANISGALLPRIVALVVWALLFVPLGLMVARSGPSVAEVPATPAPR